MAQDTNRSHHAGGSSGTQEEGSAARGCGVGGAGDYARARPNHAETRRSQAAGPGQRSQVDHCSSLRGSATA